MFEHSSTDAGTICATEGLTAEIEIRVFRKSSPRAPQRFTIHPAPRPRGIHQHVVKPPDELPLPFGLQLLESAAPTAPASPPPLCHYKPLTSSLANGSHYAGGVSSHTDSISRPHRARPRRPSHRLHQLSANSPSVRTSASQPVQTSRSYSLEIVQHPVKTAEFGDSTLTRLPLAPPLIARLVEPDNCEAGGIDETELPFLIAQLSLLAGDGSESADFTHGNERQIGQQRLLYGNLVSSPHILRNLQGKQGIYFLFPDVSIRLQGQYRLRVTLLRLPRMDTLDFTTSRESGIALAYARSLMFDVLPRAEYIAPAQTPLTQYFLQQGAQMTPTCFGQPVLYRSNTIVI